VRSSITSPGLPEAAPNRPGRAKPASGARACSARSAIETHPLGIDKDRIAHFNFDVAAANNERRKSSASIEQLRLALRRQSLHNCRKQSVSIYTRQFAIELALRFRPRSKMPLGLSQEHAKSGVPRNSRVPGRVIGEQWPASVADIVVEELRKKEINGPIRLPKRISSLVARS
jgi:hypothetical protein